jgi:hypothetical protein
MRIDYCRHFGISTAQNKNFIHNLILNLTSQVYIGDRQIGKTISSPLVEWKKS